MGMEKVIKGLSHCFHGQECCGDAECPYYIEHLSDSCCLEDCQKNLKEDTIALLKEQEAKTGKWIEMDYKPKIGAWIRHGEPPQYVVECSRCGNKYFNHALQPFARYCSGCGAKMDSWIIDDQTEKT